MQASQAPSTGRRRVARAHAARSLNLHLAHLCVHQAARHLHRVRREQAVERVAHAGRQGQLDASSPTCVDALQRIGRADRADLRLQDYRDINDAPFDAICSIEMVEAVGREYWPTYFQTVSRLLKPGGKACVQSIVIDDEHFERYIKGTDFIQQYIFPGGCLPCPTEFRAQARAAGLEVVDEFPFGLDYAETLAQWRDRFLHEHDRVLALGFDQRFMRIWEFYLAYCEAGFRGGNIDVVQYTLRKPA